MDQIGKGTLSKVRTDILFVNNVLFLQSNGDDAPLRLENSHSPGPGDSAKKSPGHSERVSRENGSILHMNGGAVSVMSVKQEPSGVGADLSPMDDDDTGPVASGRDRVPGPVNLTTGRSADALIKVGSPQGLCADVLSTALSRSSLELMRHYCVITSPNRAHPDVPNLTYKRSWTIEFQILLKICRCVRKEIL